MSRRHCIHCGTKLTRASSSKDHVPSKCFLRHPYPDNIITIRICKACNSRFSQAEEYTAAFLAMMLSDGIDDKLAKLESIIGSNHRIQDELIEGLGVETGDSGTNIAIQPDTATLNTVMVKNALGLLSYSGYIETTRVADKVVTCPISNVPEQFLPAFQKSAEWTTVQEDCYRFRVVEPSGQLVVQSVTYEYLISEVAFATEN